MNLMEFLNYKFIDPTSSMMHAYNFVYLPFNWFEAVVWVFYVPKTIRKYWSKSTRLAVTLQCHSFLLLSLSEVIETQGTTPLLILFKIAILIALVGGHKLILATRPMSKPIQES